MSSNIRLSLIIPVGPHERTCPRILDHLETLPDSWEIIVSLTGDSKPALPDRCRQVQGSAGRGIQLNRAINAANGHWLWLVHADCLPDKQAIRSADQLAARDQACLGYCDLRFERDGPWLTRLNAIGANWRSRWLNLPFGDQGYCLQRRLFDRLCGFREDLPRGEDLDFLIRARGLGLDLQAMRGTMTTSARRYRDKGWLKTTLAHQFAARRLIRDARKSSA